jgi:hypothetical protein
MLYDTAVRSVTTLVAQWRLVGRSFENMYSDFQIRNRDLLRGKPDNWPWRNPVGNASLFKDQAAFVRWSLDVSHLDTDPADPGTLLRRVDDEVTALSAKQTVVEEGRVPPKPVGAGQPPPTLLESVIYFIQGVFQATLQTLAAPIPAPGGAIPAGLKSGFILFDVVGKKVGFPLYDPTQSVSATNSDKWPQEDPLLAIEICRQRIDDLERFIIRQLDDFAVAVSSLGPGLNLQGIRSGIEDIGAYPLLTSDTGPQMRTGGAGVVTPPGTPSLQRTVDRALREVLGRNPKVGDTRSFLAALNQSFDISVVNGVQVVAYQPRSFSGQTELGGGVTGAQASLYARASVALDKALPLLDGLYPLDPAADPQEVEAVRAIVHNEFVEVVNELKSEGGPTTARVDQLLIQLFGTLRGPVRVDNPDGHLGDLADQFGFGTDAFVNTLDEESNASNFIAVFDYANQVRLGWIEFRDQYYGKDLGTRLVLLSRALSVAAESVDEVCAAMDSVFVGPAERQVASFTVPGYDHPLLVSEVLDWVTSFTTDEAPRQIQDGGRRGVAAIQPTAILLEKLVRQLIAAIPTDPGLPKGMQHARVRFPLQELRGYLDQIQLLAEDVRKPLRQSV